MEQIYKYLLVGGMPEVVDACINEGNLFEAREILGEESAVFEQKLLISSSTLQSI